MSVPASFRRTAPRLDAWRAVAFAAAVAAIGAGGFAAASSLPEFDFTNLEAREHGYWTRSLDDPFTRFLHDLESGRVTVEGSSEKEYLTNLLAALDVPVSSQRLLFSRTSLQLTRISPQNPRALYFNDELSVGYIPGGRVEVVSFDPEVGGIFYIFDLPQDGQHPAVERSNRCMNCHIDRETHEVPGLVVKSVIPGPNGGSVAGYRTGETGHHVPLEERFGGYYLTGAETLGRHHGNRVGRIERGEVLTETLDLGTEFDPARYPLPTSDLLVHLVHEHHAGFLNRTLEASYLTRSVLARTSGPLSREDEASLDTTARELVRYILFADEAPLPTGGLEGDPAFKADFLAKRLPDSAGNALRDFDLHGRLFKFRCSYLIHGRVFQALPKEFKQRVYQKIGAALRPSADPEFSYLPPTEKDAIRRILRETLPH